MQVILDLPEDLARHLSSDAGEISRFALEAVAAEGVRTGRLTTFQARQLLGIRSRYEMDGFLKGRGVMLPLSLEDVRRDNETARSIAE